MQGSRGNNPTGGASPANLADWQARRLAAIRGPKPSIDYDDELPVDLLADPEETRRILDRIRAAE